MNKNFVAINYITCDEDYRARFETLFATRAHAIDRMPGFIEMSVLRPKNSDEPYLVVSQWDSEEAFKAWMSSPEFIEGHRRGFADVHAAKAAGKTPPMQSKFLTYDIISK